ncbi:MAG: hypothetical protein ACNA8W_13605 [Bradymonadaceae bacterium]
MTKISLSLPVMMFVFAGCVWDIPEPAGNVEDMDPVSFSEDVIPIFVNNCISSGCHGVGEIRPILTADRAYDELMSMQGMVDLENPESSVLYERMVSIQSPMPPSGLLSNKDAQLILAWIWQGASDE